MEVRQPPGFQKGLGKRRQPRCIQHDPATVGPGIGRYLSDILEGERKPAQRDLPDERFGPGGDDVHTSLHGWLLACGAGPSGPWAAHAGTAKRRMPTMNRRFRMGRRFRSRRPNPSRPSAPRRRTPPATASRSCRRSSSLPGGSRSRSRRPRRRWARPVVACATTIRDSRSLVSRTIRPSAAMLSRVSARAATHRQPVAAT